MSLRGRPAWAEGLRSASLLLLFAALPMGTAALELTTGLAVLVALLVGERRLPALTGPVVAVAFALLAGTLGKGSLVEALGRVWPLAPLLAVPLLASDRPWPRVEAVGLWAAAACGLWGVGEGVLSGELPWNARADGPFSHHLTLGYALLIPFARAAWTRAWLPAVCIGLGVLASGGSGPLLSLAVVGVALAWRPAGALAGGVVAALGLMILLQHEPAMAERAILWATGGELAVTEPLGVGADGYRSAAPAIQDRIEPGYYFPNHAHDAALQVGALVGIGGWIAWAWLLVELWRATSIPGKAAIAGVVVGGLTQDTLGDLEVIRALGAWCLLGLANSRQSSLSVPHTTEAR